MKRTCLALSILALACAGWSGIPALADKNGKFPGKGSLEAYNRSCKVGNEAGVLAQRNNYLGAIELDRKAISIYPFDSMGYHNLACHLFETKRFGEAITAEDQALALEPSFNGAWILKGYCYEDSGQLNEAEKCFLRANTIECEVESCVALGNLMKAKKRFLQARSWYLKAKSLTKDASELAAIERNLKKLPLKLEASH